MEIEGACPLWPISGFRPRDRPWPFSLCLSTEAKKCQQAGSFWHRRVHPGFLSFSHSGHADAFFARPVHIDPKMSSGRGFWHRRVYPGFLSFPHRGHAEAFFVWPVHIGPTLLLSATNMGVLRSR